MRFNHTVETEASPEEIWTNINNWPAWDTELASATLDGEFAKGTSGRLRPGKRPTSTFFISDLTQGESYAFTTRLPLCELEVRRSLVRTGDGGTYFTHEVSFAGPLSFAFGRILRRLYQKSLPAVMENLRKIAEVVRSNEP